MITRRVYSCRYNLTLELEWVERQLEGSIRQGRPCPGLYLDILYYLKENPTVPWQVAWLEIMSSASEQDF
jgi:hypothetical protein